MNRSNHNFTRLVQISLFFLFQVAFLAAATLQSYATNGLPRSTKFGFGARIDPWGAQVDVALKAAADNDLDWIGVDFDWNRQWPERNGSLDLAGLDHIMSFAAENELAVLLSITNPPAWVKTPTGPNAEITAGLVSQFARLYPDVLQAVELFPSANTLQGWGAAPNPKDYVGLLRDVSHELDSTNRKIILVAGGLVPISPQDQSRDINDLAFLKRLYDQGAAQYMPVVSVRFPVLTGDPLAAPWEEEGRVLRRYELFRDVMLENGHTSGLIWVTGFSWPAPTLASVEQVNLVPGSSGATVESYQSHWLSHAQQIMKSQLYIGAAFYDCLNPPKAVSQQSNWRCLLQVHNGKTDIHSALQTLGYLNTLDNNQQKKPSGLFDTETLLRTLSP